MPLLILLLLAAATTNPVDVERDLLRFTNAERVKAGLPALEFDARLATAARQHSAEMAKQRELSHQFDGEPELSARVAKTGLRFDRAGENVSFTDYDDVAASAHRGLMNSPPHRANILNPKYTAIGIGVVPNGSAFYITEDFAHALEPLDTEALLRELEETMGVLRHSAHLEALQRANHPRLAALACRSTLTPRALFDADRTARGAVVFTTFDARDLPAQLQAQVRSARFHSYALGACPIFSSGAGNGQFQIAVLFY